MGHGHAGAGDTAGETSGAAAGPADGAIEKGSKHKGPAVGEKRKRTNFTATQEVFLAQSLETGKLDTGDKRQQVAELFSKETGNNIESKVIDTWYRNNKGKKSMGGE